MTTFNIDFNFASADQNAILSQLQAQGYTLLGYKGATGPNQVTAGVPTWFSLPFSSLFGAIEIGYTPLYQIYVFNQGNIAANTVISMSAQSAPTALGNALTFNQNGTFGSGGVTNVPPASLGLLNNSPNTVTVGLAGLVKLPNGNSQYQPFCAFTLNPSNSIIMTPLETILLVASRANLVSGNVQAAVSAPGCSFTFDNNTIQYDLQMVANSFAITNLPGTAPVLPVSSGSTIGTIVNI
ncbi:MAG: hypothetical protein ABIQ08_06530 [Duganella sp.]